MRWDKYIDADILRQAINVLKPDHQLFEVRVLGADKKRIISGYFTDCETLISELDKIDPRNVNLYITLNQINEALYSRSQHDHFVANVSTTSDNDITRYQWLFIDFDPVRPADISSSEDELLEAEALKNQVRKYLHDMNFHDPLEAISGNGYHLLYRIDLPVNDQAKQLLNDCLTALACLHNNNGVKIDTINYNPSRICKLYGTLAQKGSDTKERPHRMSRIISVPSEIQINDISVLTELANELPEESRQQDRQRPPKMMTAQQSFNLESWLASHGITYKEAPGRDGRMLLLDECPFDPSHRNGDAKIFAYNDGAVAFKCHHNSCRMFKWQDVRLKFEPDAYNDTRAEDDARINAGYLKHKQIVADKAVSEPEKKKPKPKRKLKSATELMKKDIPELKIFLGVGEDIPLLVEGTCILSAKPKLGKSWFALSLALAVANGDDFLGYKTNKSSVLYLDLETSESIQKKRLLKALDGKKVPTNFYLETETDQLEHGFVEQIEEYMKEDPQIGVIIIDVFQIIRTASKNQKETEYEHAYRDITPLNELAQKYHISIILVCHDRKAVDPDDPFSNILGSTGLQGAAAQMIVMYRKNKDKPIHIAIKGKTIDGQPDMDVKLENAQWSVVENIDDADVEKERNRSEFLKSEIRNAVVAIAENNSTWKGSCSALIHDAREYGIYLEDSPKWVGLFLHKSVALFHNLDRINIEVVGNGTGGKKYVISKFTVADRCTVDATVDESENEWQEVPENGAYSNPFL